MRTVKYFLGRSTQKETLASKRVHLNACIFVIQGSMSRQNDIDRTLVRAARARVRKDFR
jgi:hypothetical protein